MKPEMLYNASINHAFYEICVLLLFEHDWLTEDSQMDFLTAAAIRSRQSSFAAQTSAWTNVKS